MKKNSIKVGLIQQASSQNSGENLDKIILEIKRLASMGAELITLQELHNSIYFCQAEDPSIFDLAETIPGKSTEIFSSVAADNKVVIVSSLFEKRAPGLYHNTAVVFESDGSIAGKYRKMHIPDDPAYYEKFYFTPGDLGYKVFETKFAKIGILICWDQWYPEASRITALMGADIMFYPTAIGWDTTQDEETNQDQYNAWQTIQRSHSVANGLPVISVNRVGFEQEGRMKFWGGSFATNAQGKLLYLASHDQEETKVVDVDLKQSDYIRKHWPFLRDRRIDSYQPITKRYIDED